MRQRRLGDGAGVEGHTKVGVTHGMEDGMKDGESETSAPCGLGEGPGELAGTAKGSDSEGEPGLGKR